MDGIKACPPRRFSGIPIEPVGASVWIILNVPPGWPVGVGAGVVGWAVVAEGVGDGGVVSEGVGDAGAEGDVGAGAGVVVSALPQATKNSVAINDNVNNKNRALFTF
jgi:hypothetical protein